MELRTLRYFLAAAREGNITRAAENLHVTQPTLSRQLMELERELGTTLMIRGRKGLMLTSDGALFKQQAEEIIELADRAKQSFAGEKDSVSGLVAVGVLQIAGEASLAKSMQRFSEKYPSVEFHIIYYEAEAALHEHLEKGMIDLGLVQKSCDTAEYDYINLPEKGRWGLLLSEEHPLAEEKAIEYTAAAEYPLIFPLKKEIRMQIVKYMGKQEAELNILLSSARLADAIPMIAEGMGCACCVEEEAKLYENKCLKFIPLVPEHTVGGMLIWRKGRLFSLAASLFIQEINGIYAR